MSGQIINWLNYKLKMNLSLNDFEKTFSNGYYFGLILFYYNFNQNFFDVFKNKFQINYINTNYKKLKEIFPILNLKLENSKIKRLIKEEKGLAQRIWFDLKNNLEKYENNLKIQNKTGMDNNELIYHRNLLEKNYPPKIYNIEKKLIKYQDYYNNLKEQAFIDQNKEIFQIKEYYKNNRDKILLKNNEKKIFIKNWEKDKIEAWKNTINQYKNNRNYENEFINKMTEKLINKNEKLIDLDKQDYVESLKEFDDISKKFGLGFENKDGSFDPNKKPEINIEANIQKIKERIIIREKIQKEKKKNERKTKIEKLKFEENKKIEWNLKNRIDYFNKQNLSKSSNIISEIKENFKNNFYNKNIEKYLDAKKLDRKNISVKFVINQDILEKQKERVFELKTQIVNNKMEKYEKNYSIMKQLLYTIINCAENINEKMVKNKDNQISKEYYNKVINYYLLNNKNEEELLLTQNNNFSKTGYSDFNFSYKEKKWILKNFIIGNKSYFGLNNYCKFLKIKNNNFDKNKELSEIYFNIIKKNLYFNHFELLDKGLIYECPKILYYGENIDDFIKNLNFKKVKIIDINKIYNKFKKNYDSYMEEYNLRKKKKKKDEPEEEITDEKILFFDKIKDKEELSVNDKYELFNFYAVKFEKNKNILLSNIDDIYDKKVIVFNNFPSSLENMKNLDEIYGNFMEKDILINNFFLYFTKLVKKLNSYEEFGHFNLYDYGFFDLVINDKHFNKNKILINYFKNFGRGFQKDLDKIYYDTEIPNLTKLLISSWQYRISYYIKNEKNYLNKTDDVEINKNKSLLLIKKTTIIKSKSIIFNEKPKIKILNILKNFDKKYFKKSEFELCKIKSNYMNIKENFKDKILSVKNIFENYSKNFKMINNFIYSFNNFKKDNTQLIDKDYTKAKLLDKLENINLEFWDYLLSLKDDSLNILSNFSDLENLNLYFDNIFKCFYNINIYEINRIYFLIQFYNDYNKIEIELPNLDFNENNIPKNIYDLKNLNNFSQIKYLKEFILNYVENIKNILKDNNIITIELVNLEKRLIRFYNYIEQKLTKTIVYFLLSYNCINEMISFYMKNLNDNFIIILNNVKNSINNSSLVSMDKIEKKLSLKKLKSFNFSEFPKIELINKIIIKTYFLYNDIVSYFNKTNKDNYEFNINISVFIKYISSRITLFNNNIINFKLLPTKFYKLKNNELLKIWNIFNENEIINVKYFIIFILVNNYPILKDVNEINKINSLDSIIWMDEYDEKLIENLDEKSTYITFYIKKFLKIIINNDIQIYKNFLLKFKDYKEAYYKEILKNIN